MVFAITSRRNNVNRDVDVGVEIGLSKAMRHTILQGKKMSRRTTATAHGRSISLNTIDTDAAESLKWKGAYCWNRKVVSICRHAEWRRPYLLHPRSPLMHMPHGRTHVSPFLDLEGTTLSRRPPLVEVALSFGHNRLYIRGRRRVALITHSSLVIASATTCLRLS